MDWLTYFVSLTAVTGCSGDVLWGRFASSSKYSNSRLMFEDSDVVLTSFVYSKSSPELWTRMACARECLGLAGCQSLNFYPSESHYICEVLVYGFCQNTTRRFSLKAQPDGTVYDKLHGTRTTSCLDQTFENVPAEDWCETARPGCTGTWPDCAHCVQSCTDCAILYNRTGHYTCTLYPGGTSTQPIFASCYNNKTYIMKRSVNLQNGDVNDYLMDFIDMNRLVELKIYTKLQIYFHSASRHTYSANYRNPYVDINGTLSNLTFMFSNSVTNVDSLDLNGAMLAPSPFVWVYNDSENCGSFWQFKASNALHCPGGSIGVFGTVKLNASGQVIHSGMQWPGANGDLLYNCDIGLA